MDTWRTRNSGFSLIIPQQKAVLWKAQLHVEDIAQISAAFEEDWDGLRCDYFFVHCTGTRMISQGTDGLSQCSLLEEVLVGQYMDISKSATDRYHPPILDYINSWTGKHHVEPLLPEELLWRGMGLLVAPKMEMAFGSLVTVKQGVRCCGSHRQWFTMSPWKNV